MGGLGSAVAEMLMESGTGNGKRFARLGFPDVFTEELGSQNEIMNKYGLSAENLVLKTKQLLNNLQAF
jgi:transketolase